MCGASQDRLGMSVCHSRPSGHVLPLSIIMFQSKQQANKGYLQSNVNEAQTLKKILQHTTGLKMIKHH